MPKRSFKKVSKCGGLRRSSKRKSWRGGAAAKKSPAKKTPVKKSPVKTKTAKKSPVKTKTSAVKKETKRPSTTTPSGSVSEANRFLLREMGYSLKNEDDDRRNVLKKAVEKFNKALIIAHLKNIKALSQFEENKVKLDKDIAFLDAL